MAEWKYLWSPAFQSRYALAAWLLKDCTNVLEIGGYKTPITDFLDLDDGIIKSVIGYDPKMLPCHERYDGLRGQVQISHYPLSFRGDTLSDVTLLDCGVALLGLDLVLDEPGWENLLGILKAASRIVIEYAVTFPTAIKQYARILEETKKKVVFQAGLDLSGNDFGDLADSAPLQAERRIVVLE